MLVKLLKIPRRLEFLHETHIHILPWVGSFGFRIARRHIVQQSLYPVRRRHCIDRKNCRIVFSRSFESFRVIELARVVWGSHLYLAFRAGLASVLPAHKIKIQVFVNGRKIIDVTGDEVSTDAPRRQRD